jgi:hypothetical protein
MTPTRTSGAAAVLVAVVLGLAACDRGTDPEPPPAPQVPQPMSLDGAERPVPPQPV